MSNNDKIISTIYEFLKAWCQKNALRQKLARETLLQSVQQRKNTIMQYEMQYELYYTMSGSHYNCITNITAPKHIRPYGWNTTPAGTIFFYALSAVSIPARTILDMVKDDINNDISQFQQNVILAYGNNTSFKLYPYTLYGMFVVNIQGVGSDIVIGVMTNYDPDNPIN